jgi:hypothetical protein
MWYCRHEIQLRQALFFSAASVAGAFSGLLAFAISKMDGVGGLAGWRWIFILEGLATVVVAVLAFFVLHDFPETASFLTEEERAFIVFRLRYQGQVAAKAGGEDNKVAEADEFRWRYVRDAFTDWQIWVNVWVYWGVRQLQGDPPVQERKGNFANAMMLLDRLPHLRHQPLLANHHQQPWLHFEHRTADDSTHLHHGCHSCRHRCLRLRPRWQAKPLYHRLPLHGDCGIFHVGSRMLRIISCELADTLGRCISSPNPKVVYAGVFIAACAIYPAFPGVITWLCNNLAGSYKRSAGMAIQIGAGNLGGGMSSSSCPVSSLCLTRRCYHSHGLQFLQTSRLTTLQTGPWLGTRLHLRRHHRQLHIAS